MVLEKIKTKSRKVLFLFFSQTYNFEKHRDECGRKTLCSHYTEEKQRILCTLRCTWRKRERYILSFMDVRKGGNCAVASMFSLFQLCKVVS
jgi:hypothetical protein